MSRKTNTVTVRLQITSGEGQQMHYDLETENNSSLEHNVTAVLIKLLRNSWAVAPGDVIRIEEV